MYLLTDILTEMSFYQIGLILKYALNITFIVVPIIVTIMAMIDVFKLVTKPENPGTTVKAVVTRLIAGLIVFMLPSLISATFSLIDN